MHRIDKNSCVNLLFCKSMCLVTCKIQCYNNGSLHKEKKSMDMIDEIKKWKKEKMQ